MFLTAGHFAWFAFAEAFEVDFLQDGVDGGFIGLAVLKLNGQGDVIVDIEIVKDELISNDISKILYTDLTRPELDISVVRVIIPEMELYALDQTRAGYRFLKV